MIATPAATGFFLGFDNRNVVIFRDASKDSALATTYSWYSNGVLLDADIIFWDGGFKFFTGSSGCSGGPIEDIAAHEFGHALGLKHSEHSDATMYASYSWCSQKQRTLAADDIAGVEFLYPPASSNSAPGVTISLPGNNSSYAQGTSIGFAGSASDPEDGNLSSGLVWTSSLDGQIGTGASFSKALSAGTHTITASVKDKGGLTGSAKVSTTVTAVISNPSSISLTATGYKLKGVNHVDLTWLGATSTSVDILRDGVRLLTTANTGKLTDSSLHRGGGTYTYTVCEAGTSTCSTSVTVVF